MRGIEIIIIASVALTPAIASAQLRRREAPPGGETRTPGAQEGARMRGANPRFPFAGAWEGSVMMKDGPSKEPRSIAMMFDAADSGKTSYAGFTVYPNGARAPHVNTVAARDSLRWEQSNSGGGHWVYAARLVSPDSVVGTLTLHDAPWHPETMPHGTFVMVRRTAAASTR
jgi:hypothetical protein